MKVMKTLKTLKFWSRKKKKKKITNLHHQSPPPCCCCHHPVQPSAPPLPTWIDYEEQTYNQHLLEYEVNFSEFSGLPVSYQAHIDPQEDSIGNVPPEPVNPPLSSESSGGGIGCSYQQYLVENPVNGVPVLQSRKTERSAGGVGCVFNIGAHLFRCFFPCFRIRDV
ncbi:uncharacterized protein LOC111883967 [Lactuca sativa]|uniref:uncharacterized protein LOC111883967 n=1 Tax=Lactuca sativa TaxID=4236 RepID=UPI000CBCEBE3|nr:uncharacterized protein LOC111883967 [Lactuca sativa]